MKEVPEAIGNARPKLQSDLIDQACDRFEAAVRTGKKPKIEDFLDEYSNLNRDILLQELIALEVELLGINDNSTSFNTGESQVSFHAYYDRFPEAVPVLDGLQKEMELKIADSSQFSEISGGYGSDADTVQRGDSDSRRQIKQFELQSILGHGGFGIVWKAKDKRLQRDVAIKVPRPDRLAPSDRTLFLREARAAAKLHHPHIISIHEVGEHDSQIYIVSELVDGVSLKTWLETGRLSPADAASLMAKLATAVHHAHEQGIVHRDLKPANVLIDKKGEPHVADFGLAKRDTGEESLSVSGQLMGTPAYMSPEQARGEHGLIDVRTDVYALGAIFYELLTGERPFKGEMSILLEHIQHTPPKAPRQIKPDIPRELEAICLKCLSKDPAKRYATGKDLAADLHLFLAGETLRGIPAALPHRVRKWLTRHRRAVTAVALSFVLSLTIAGGLAWQFRGTKPVPLDLRKVAFITQPAGCEITVVTLDPQTGEPDPTKIQHAKGRTPLTMNLEGGDYLVVAVLDENRFTEVYRHVPPRNETIPTFGPHRHWEIDPSGTVQFRKIDIPRPDVTVGMGFVEGANRVREPQRFRNAPNRIWKLPPFFVDPSEITTKDIERWGIEQYGQEKWERRKWQRLSGWGPGKHSLANYPDSLVRLEKRGRRTPTAAELYYLSKVVCSAKRADNLETSCTLDDGTRLEGLHSGVWEWTATRAGGPFTGIPLPQNPQFTDEVFKVIGCGPPDEKFPMGFKIFMEFSLNEVGARGVRSIKPRRRPEDFMTLVEMTPVN